ncbi:hypothetical protein RAF57_27840, partial [Klebsiella pneumoniae]
TDDLFVGKTLLHGDVLMWLMKTLLTSRCINQRGSGQQGCIKGLSIGGGILVSESIIDVANVPEGLF